MYTGKEICHGCGKSGYEKPRYSKNQLCQDCEDIINKGKSVKNEDLKKYIYVFQHYFAYPSSIYDGKLNDIAHLLLESVNNPDAVNYSGVCYIKNTFGSNGKYYKIPEQSFELIKKVMDELENILSDLKIKEEEIPKLILNQMKIERDKIYNEGIEYGRNLLVQLNKGEITHNEFIKKIEYKS